MDLTDIVQRLRSKNCCSSEHCRCDETADEIERLEATNKILRDTLRGIADADWRKWDEEVRSSYEFVVWAKSRASNALARGGQTKEK